MFMSKKILILPVLLGLLIACGNNQNPSNPPEEGNSVFHSGEGAPSASIGKQYDHYLDLTSKYVYEKNDGKWYNKFSVGSDVLLDTSSSKIKSHDDNNVIKTALSNTFYSTNISFEYYLKGGLSTELQKTFDFKIDKEAAHIVASVGGSTSNIYFRVTTDGKDQYYMEGMTDGFVDVNNPNLYCTLPFPSLECIANNYYAIRDDDIGGFAALIVSDLSRVEYNEESGFYSISHITASQTGFDYKGYIVEAGESDFSVSFKLSEDQKYISTLNGTVHHSSIGGRDGDEFKMEFNSFHQTVVVLPE